MARFVNTITLAAVLVAVFANAPFAQPTTLPELTDPVHDLANVIDPSTEVAIASRIRILQQTTGDTVIVVTVPTVEPYANVQEYGTELFENHGRGIGDRAQDNGVLVLLAMKEREVRVEVGYGLEQWITDGFTGQISRELMVPEFRNGRYGQGLLDGTNAIIGRIAQGRNVTLPGVETPARRERQDEFPIPFPVVVLIFLAIVLLARRAGGPGRTVRRWDRNGWSGWSSGVGPFGGSWGGGGWHGGGMGGGGFGGFGGGRSGGGGGGARW